MSPTVRPYGDHAVLVEWSVAGFDAAVSDQVHSLAARLRKHGRFTEVMPGYDSVVASFDSARMSVGAAKRRIETILVEEARQDSSIEGKRIDIPVHYGGSDGPEEESQQLIDLRVCIKKLDEADAGIIALYLEELPYKEISEITGLTENHVAVKIKRIKNKLLNCVNERS